MKSLPLTALRALAAVHRAGGVRAAARLLGVTHSTVSRQVRELELWIGAPLFETRGRGEPVFTPAGARLGVACVSALSELEQAVSAVQERRRPNRVSIATTASIAARWLVPRLARLRHQHPRIEVSVVTEQRISAPDGYDIDLALRMGAGPYAGCKAEALSGDTLIPVVSRSVFEALGADHAAALTRLDLLHDRDPQASWASWLSVHPIEGVDAARGPRFTSSDLVLTAAAAGLGCALARQVLAASAIADGSLVALFDGRRTVRSPTAYWLIWPADDAPRPAVRTVADWIKFEAQRS